MRYILHRYIFLDLLKVFALSTSALTCFLAIAYALSELRERGLGPFDSLQLIVCFIPAMLIFAMPISALLTTTLVYGKLASENEITACRASGISMTTILWPVVVLGLLVGAVNFALFDRVIPWSWYRAEDIGTQNLERIFFHQLRTKKSVRHRNFHIKAKHIEGNMLYGVVTSYDSGQGRPVTAYAPAAHLRFYPPLDADEKITVTARQGQITRQAKDYARERANNILLAFPRVEKVRIILDIEGRRAVAECIANVKFAGSVSQRRTGEDMTAAIAETTEDVGRQLMEGQDDPQPEGDAEAAAQPPVKQRRREEEIAADSWDASVTDRGRVLVQLFGVHASNPGRSSTFLGDYSFVRSLNNVRVREPREMTLMDLHRRYREPEKTFEYLRGTDRGAGPVALAQAAQKLKATSLAEEHSRYASIVSCVLLVGLGAVLGTMFRHGHILTAFAVSMGPGLLAIFAVLVGVQMVQEQPDSMHGLVWVIWSGNIVLLAIDAILIPRLLRR